MRFRLLVAVAVATLLFGVSVAAAYDRPDSVAAERGDEPGSVKHFAATIVSGDSEPGPVPLPPVKPAPVAIPPGSGRPGGPIGTTGTLLPAGPGATARLDPLVASEHRMRRLIRLLD